MIGQIFKEIIVVIQINFQFVGHAADKLPGNHLYLYCVLLKRALPDIAGMVQSRAQLTDIILGGHDAAILRNVSENILGHCVLVSINFGLRLQHLALTVAVNHNAELKLDIPKRGVRQELLVHMLLLADDLLNDSRVPCLYADVTADNILPVCLLILKQSQQEGTLIALLAGNI